MHDQSGVALPRLRLQRSHPTGRLVAVKLSRGTQPTAVRVADSSGLSSAADAELAMPVTYGATGTPEPGEDGVQEVGGLLVERWNQDGARWGRAEVVAFRGGRSEQGVDLRVVTVDGSRTVNVQVTRAEQRLWSELARTRTATMRHAHAEAAADAIRVAIEKKSSRIPVPRDTLVLALDARHAAWAALVHVDTAFRQRHGSWSRQLGFQAIWVVGPVAQLVRRLDISSPERVPEATAPSASADGVA